MLSRPCEETSLHLSIPAWLSLLYKDILGVIADICLSLCAAVILECCQICLQHTAFFTVATNGFKRWYVFVLALFKVLVAFLFPLFFFFFFFWQMSSLFRVESLLTVHFPHRGRKSDKLAYSPWIPHSALFYPGGKKWRACLQLLDSLQCTFPRWREKWRACLQLLAKLSTKRFNKHMTECLKCCFWGSYTHVQLSKVVSWRRWWQV